jgi:adenylate cyclase
MGKEIERKFLVVGDVWRSLGPGTLMQQGYLSTDLERVVRVRLEGEDASMTIKGQVVGATRGEWEYTIPKQDAEEMLAQLCLRPLIEKTRYRIMHEGMLWEVDEFLGDNEGLVVAEIELTSEDQPFAKPAWVGEEVTGDARYYNANLLMRPYSAW